MSDTIGSDNTQTIYNLLQTNEILMAALVRARDALETCKEEDGAAYSGYAYIKTYNDTMIEESIRELDQLLNGGDNA